MELWVALPNGFCATRAFLPGAARQPDKRMRRITFSRNFTLSLSGICLAYCKYSAFATHQAHLRTLAEVEELLDAAMQNFVPHPPPLRAGVAEIADQASNARWTEDGGGPAPQEMARFDRGIPIPRRESRCPSRTRAGRQVALTRAGFDSQIRVPGMRGT